MSMSSARAVLSVCAVCAVAAFALATPAPFPSSALRSRGQVADDEVAPAAPAEPAAAPPSERRPARADDDDLGRGKKIKKGNATIGEEVLGAIVDGLSGESEDAEFGSEIRKEFGFLVDAVANLSVSTINKYAQSRAVPVTVAGEDHARTARAVDNVGEGRRRQVRRLLVRYLVLLKVFALGIILPGAVLLSLLQSWKAVTLSLMALLLAGVIGLRGLVSTAAKGQAAEVIHTTGPGVGGHYWRRVSGPEAGQEPDRLAYGAYVPAS